MFHFNHWLRGFIYFGALEISYDGPAPAGVLIVPKAAATGRDCGLVMLSYGGGIA